MVSVEGSVSGLQIFSPTPALAFPQCEYTNVDRLGLGRGKRDIERALDISYYKGTNPIRSKSHS